MYNIIGVVLLLKKRREKKQYDNNSNKKIDRLIDFEKRRIDIVVIKDDDKTNLHTPIALAECGTEALKD